MTGDGATASASAAFHGGTYVNLRDKSARYSTRIPSAIYDEVENPSPYHTHILPLAAHDGDGDGDGDDASCERRDNSRNESSACRNHNMGRKRSKSDDDGYDSNCNESMDLQEGEVLLVENDLYESKS